MYTFSYDVLPNFMLIFIFLFIHLSRIVGYLYCYNRMIMDVPNKFKYNIRNIKIDKTLKIAG